MIPNPLVTIAVLSYNNCTHIAQCIESCLSQSYSNVEIIIADDASTDNSIHIIKSYLEKNPGKIKAIFSNVNSGVAVNFNDAVRASSGSWFKVIASDDILMPDCIRTYVEEVYKRKISSGILFGRVLSFGEGFDTSISDDNPSCFVQNRDGQLSSLLHGNPLSAPSAFFEIKTLYKIGLADESYPFLEDYPLWLKCVLMNVPLYFVNSITVKYRVHQSLSMPFDRIGHLGFYNSIYFFSKNEIWPRRRGLGLFKNFREYVRYKKFIYSIKIFDNKRTLCFRLINKFFSYFGF